MQPIGTGCIPKSLASYVNYTQRGITLLYEKRLLMRYGLVIFSNQSRISFDPKAKLFPQWKQKLQAIAETVTPPLCMLMISWMYR